jgi:hypothetical protein
MLVVLLNLRGAVMPFPLVRRENSGYDGNRKKNRLQTYASDCTATEIVDEII